MAWDLARQRAVLFGGADDTGLLADTWEWDGSSWTRRAPGVSPSARVRHAMAYDAARQRIVLYGGSVGPFNGSVPIGDTWEWDGSSWIPHQPATSPGAREWHAMAYDVARQRVVLFGGSGLSLGTGTWEWDGSNWTQLQLATSPAARFGHAMTYDVSLQRIVLVSGSGALDSFGDSWFLRATSRAAATSFGSGCGGANGIPTLLAGTPYLGNGGFALELLDAAPGHACVFGLSAFTQGLPLGGGCTLYLGAPIWASLALTNPFGAASVVLSIPPDPVLRGVTLFVQAAVADPTGPAGGASITAGARLVLGD